MMAISKKNIRFNNYSKSTGDSFMLSIGELCVGKSCGNIFVKRAGLTIITGCPHCDGRNFDTSATEEDLV